MGVRRRDVRLDARRGSATVRGAAMRILPGLRLFSGDVYYGAWSPRRHDNMIARAECVDLDTTGGKVTITFYTKNKDDPGDGVLVENGEDVPVAFKLVVDTKGAVTGTLVDSSSVSSFGMKEIVRCRYTWSGGSSGDWLLLRQFPFVFFDDADGAKT
jgi:hypothetical protein